MKKSKISAVVLLALAGAAYVSSTQDNEGNHPAPYNEPNYAAPSKNHATPYKNHAARDKNRVAAADNEDNYAAPTVNRSSDGCDPNYSGCVPIASDVDCAGGGGNGPAYVQGPVRVIGTDIYHLDRDGDGVGCE